MKNNKRFRHFSLFIIFLWLGLLAFIPLLLVLVTSFLSHNDQTLIVWKLSLQSYSQLLDYTYLRILLQSLALASLCTLACLLIGYPAAYIIARSAKRWKPLLLMLVVIPFWTSSLIRTYAMLAILKTKGLVNSLLMYIGIIHHPLPLLYNNSAVLIGSIYNLLPFMILPLFTNIEKLDTNLIEAARDLGAKRWRLLTQIILPLTSPGIIAGCLLVFLPTMTLFYIPVILGGAKSLLLGNLIQNQFLLMRDWPGGAATSIVLTLFMLLLIYIYRRMNKDKRSAELLA